MCGRYYIDDGTEKELEDIVRELDQKQMEIKRGDIYPTNQAPILIAENSRVKPILSTWGFPNFKKSGVIINARCESVFEKPLFHQSLIDRRCLIPVSGFYEWNSQKEKYKFMSQQEHTLYLCGIFQLFQGENRFVILTTNANLSMSDIHSRMPLILTGEKQKEWVLSKESISELIKEEPPFLKRTAEYEQQRLEFY